MDSLFCESCRRDCKCTSRPKPHECNCEFCGSPETVVPGETVEERVKRTAGWTHKQKLCSCDVNKTELHVPVHDSEKCSIQDAGLPCDEHDSEKAVETKIREVTYSVAEHGNIALESQLRELVKLAREGGKR